MLLTTICCLGTYFSVITTHSDWQQCHLWPAKSHSLVPTLPQGNKIYLYWTSLNKLFSSYNNQDQHCSNGGDDNQFVHKITGVAKGLTLYGGVMFETDGNTFNFLARRGGWGYFGLLPFVSLPQYHMYQPSTVHGLALFNIKMQLLCVIHIHVNEGANYVR